MSFQSFAAIGRKAAENIHWQYVYKPTVPAHGTAGLFIDLNQSAGIPKYNPFAGSALTATPLTGAGNFGIYAGNFISGRSKHLISMQLLQTTVANGPPDYAYLLDYLTFYPLIDADDPTEQLMDNTQPLPRYSDGKVVIIVQAPMAASAPMTINYTNQDGVSGRTSTHTLVTGIVIGALATGVGSSGATNAANPFFPLANGDTGVRSIESVTMGGSAGGFLCAAIVRPIAQIADYESNVPTEKTFPIFGMYPPEILDGACLNFIVHRGGSATGGYRAELLFVNS